MSDPFRGLSAFPLTPMSEDQVDEEAFVGLIERIVAAGVDSIAALGSTGSYAYLSSAERRRVARLAVETADAVPVIVGVGALRTSEVLSNVDAAEEAGASAVLLAPVSYQPLTDDDVFELFHTVSERASLPVIVYDNPGTTRFRFTMEVYARVAELPGIASIKIQGLPAESREASEHVASVRASIPAHVTIGVSGDAFGAAGLNAGCDAWYSVIAGTLPEPALTITRLAQSGHADEAIAASEQLGPLWDLFAEFGGSLRVVAAIAEHLGLAPHRCLPLPIQGLNGQQRARIASIIDQLQLA